MTLLAGDARKLWISTPACPILIATNLLAGARVERFKMPNTPLDLPRDGPSQNRPSNVVNTSDTARRVSATNKTTTDPSPLPSKNDAEDRYQKGQDSTQNRDKCQNIPAMSRLLDKTNNQMEAPENKTRRNVMAQLRSAFAMILADQTNPKVILRGPPPKGAGTASD